MLKVRIIPTLLWKDSGLVKGISFDSWRRVGTVLPAVKVYNMREVDELMVLDITASQENREPDYESVAEFSGDCFVPLTIGGGIRTIDHIKKLLRSGADKVAINSSAYDEPDLIARAAMFFGSQCVVASIDAREMDDGNHYCFSHCGSTRTGKEVVAWAKELEKQGAGEILITSVEKDGTMEGYDLTLIRKVSENVGIPVIASGGAGNYQHMYEALSIGKSSAVAAASMFHFTEQTPLEAKQFLQGKGICVRNANMRQ